MKNILFVIIFQIIFAFNSNSQTTFQKTFGGISDEQGFSVYKTTDNGYVITGYTKSFGPGAPANTDIYLIRINAAGDTLWTKTYGGFDSEWGQSVRQTSEGGYIVVGWTLSFGAGSYDIYLIKTDSNGSPLWTKTYGGVTADFGTSVRQTTDGGYVVLGSTSSFSSGEGDVYLIKTDVNGDVQWTKAYGGSSNEEGWSVEQTSDGGYIIVGRTWSFGAGGTDVYLIKTDANGDILWTRTYGGSNNEVGYSVEQTTGEGYIITGSTQSFGIGRNVYIIKTDLNGNLLWAKAYGGNNYDYGFSIRQTYDNGYIVSGSTQSFGGGGWDIYLIKTDTNGNILWTKAFGGIYDDYGYSVEQTSDGGYIIIGHTASFGVGINDIYLIKTDANGNSGCNEFSTITITSNSSTLVSSGGATNSGTTVNIPSTIVSNTSTIHSVLCYDLCLVTSIINTDVSFCNGDDGAIDLTISGGTQPYTYIWSNGASTQDLSGLTAGSYTVTVTDASGCVVNKNILIDDTFDLAITIGALPDTADNSVGAAWVYVSGGTPPYSYQWDDFAQQITDTAYNLQSGTYNVVVTDSTGCISSAAITINEITNVFDPTNEYEIKVYPNPTNGQFNLIVSTSLNIKKLFIRLYQVDGQLIYTKEVSTVQNSNVPDFTYTLQMDQSECSRGLYYLQVITDKNVIIKKVIFH